MKILNPLFLFFLLVFFSNVSISQDLNERLIGIQNTFTTLEIDNPGLNEELDINIVEASLSNFLIAISKVHNLNISVSPELSQITLANNFSDVKVADVLLFLVKEYNLTIDFTGNIMAISRYQKPPEKPKEKIIEVEYSPSTDFLTLDLQNDPLNKVFRKIMDVSGKNLLYTKDIESNLLSLYLNDVPFNQALEKLAETNNLIFRNTDDGFYTFESAFENSQVINSNNQQSRPVRKTSRNFYYKVLDTLSKRIAVDLQNTPIADVIYTLGNDLGLDIFIASPLENAGTVTVTAENISFDLLLEKIFESRNPVNATQSSGNQPNSSAQSSYTFKKKDNIYYFGTEDQLSIKKVEIVPLMFRSIQLLENPSGNGQRRAGRTALSSSSLVPNYNSNLNQFQSQPNATRNNSQRSSGSSNLSSIEDIIPDDIKANLDIKLDTELNSFIVNGPSSDVERFKNFIKFIDKPVPVILIEVMILEINRSTITETGVSFGLGESPVETRGEFFPNANVSVGAKDVNKVIGNFNGFGALNIGRVVPNFYLNIQAMEAAGNLRIKSTPKLATINGHKAYLSSGETSYYAITSQTFFGSQNPQVSEVKNYVPIDAELSLEILPFVSGDGQITLDIQVLQSAFNGQRIDEDAPPGLTSREFSSIVRMRNEDVVVLGGIESIRKDNSGSGVPFLARIPIIKFLFSKRRREASKQTLNVLIRPIIIN